MLIRKGDMVRVVTGDDRGTTARVLRVIPDENKVVVEGVNKVYKHLKPSRRNPQGGRLSKEMPISASNVLLFCPTCRRGVRIGRALLQRSLRWDGVRGSQRLPGERSVVQHRHRLLPQQLRQRNLLEQGLQGRQPDVLLGE